MSTEYFHPKTTPTTPIRTAVRMSTALPGNFTISIDPSYTTRERIQKLSKNVKWNFLPK